MLTMIGAALRPVIELPLNHLAGLNPVISNTVAINIYGREDRRNHGMRVALVPTGLLEGRSMVRRSAHYRKSRREIDTVRKRNSLERCKSLVMIHSQSRIEAGIVSEPEETVRRILAEGIDDLIQNSFDRRDNDFLFLFPQKTSVTAMRVQTQHGYLRIINAEISLKRRLHEPEF